MPNDLDNWTEAILYQVESVARDRLEVPPLQQRLKGMLGRMLEEAGKCLPSADRSTLTILPPNGRLKQHEACHGKGCEEGGCGGFGWVRRGEEL